MATSLGATTPSTGYAAPRSASAVADATIPWFLLAVALAATFVVVGIIWDISWHMTIGRDTFWTPAHMCTYTAGLIVGVSCGWVALKTTFAGTTEERARAVRFWGFRAPLGAWIAVWGSFAMLTSAPFDNWWHDAYGLDVKIISPPHTLLALGMEAIVFGALVWTLGWQNRVDTVALKRRLEALFLYDAGLLVSMAAIFITQYTERPMQHSTLFLRVAGLTFPVLLVGIARGSTRRWPATTAAVVYMAVRIVMGWVLPLFPAQPKLGPIFNPVDHMVAMEFPLLLVAPALAIDALMQRLGKDTTPGRDWLAAPLYGAAFVAALAVAQWPFADFLMSSASRNWLFFTDRNFSYGLPHFTPYYQSHFYWLPPGTMRTMIVAQVAFALLFAALSARLGLAWGRWMRRVVR